MGDDWTEVDTVTDASGKTIAIGYAGEYVRAAIRYPGGVVLTQLVFDAESREQFQRAFMAAERAAETYDPAHPF